MSSSKKVVVDSLEEAIDGLKSGMTCMFGGFGLSGIPTNLIHAIRDRPDIKDLIAVSTESGVSDWGLGLLIESRQIKRQLCSFIGRCKVMEKQYLAGELELEMMPQGTLAERIRAGGAGIAAVYVPSGGNTWVEQGKVPLRYDKDGSVAETGPARETRQFNGKKFLLEPAITADFAMIKVKVADEYGNCRFATTARNFNPLMAMAAKVTVVEAEEIVPVGALHPDDVHLPGIFVQRVVKAPKTEKRFEVLNYRDDSSKSKSGKSSDPRTIIVKRAAKEFKEGMYANLGVGMPSEAPAYVSEGKVHLQSENGILGVGPLPRKGEEDADLIDAGKAAITFEKGAASFDSATSFAMVRGGHLDMTMLGGMEVSQYGDLANWCIPGKKVSGMGGAMDLVANPEHTKVVCLMRHTDKNGKSKIKKDCDLPLTGARCVRRIITELAVFDVDPKKGLTLIEVAANTTVDEVKKKTDAPFQVAKDLKKFGDEDESGGKPRAKL